MKINVSNHLTNFQSLERNSNISLQPQTTQTNSTQITERDYESEKSKVQQSVTKMNDFIEPLVTDLKFVYHEDLHEYYVTIINPLTDEVIREIPPKKMLDIYAAMTEYMGLLVDKKI